jgi:hypothetical protein
MPLRRSRGIKLKKRPHRSAPTLALPRRPGEGTLYALPTLPRSPGEGRVGAFSSHPSPHHFTPPLIRTTVPFSELSIFNSAPACAARVRMFLKPSPLPSAGS